MSDTNSTPVLASSQQTNPPNSIKRLAAALNRPQSVTLRLLDALLAAPDGLDRDELQLQTFGYPAETHLDKPYNNLHVTISNYNRGRVKHAPSGYIVREDRRYRLARLDLDMAQVSIQVRAHVPLSLLQDGNRLVCRVVDGALVVESEAA